jgi:hypothetical protein
MNQNNIYQELTTKELFVEIVRQLEDNQIFFQVYGTSFYLVQNNTNQKHRIKIGQLKNLEAKKYNQSCDID